MPDHFHLTMTPTEISVEKAIQFIKGGFSYRVKKELGLNCEIWERGYIDHRIRDANDYLHHVAYTRFNPVKARMTLTAEEYPYSSAHSGFDLDPCPARLTSGPFAGCLTETGTAPLRMREGTASSRAVNSIRRLRHDSKSCPPDLTH
jgi:REP-associated tyrosine transposase